MRDTTSRIALAAVMAVGMTAGLTGPASADVDVTVTITKDKTITVDESITKIKDVDFVVTVDVPGNGAAEAQALANVLSHDNNFTLEGVSYQSLLLGSVIGNDGITQVNEAAGNLQNQGNLVAAGLAATGDAFVNAQAEVDQVNLNLGTGNVNNSFLTADMTVSVTGNTGVTQVNQDAGNQNNQTNAVAVAAGVDTAGTDVLVALAEAALGQESSDHVVNESNNAKTADILGSITGNDGITHVNQAVGMYANQANVVSVGAAVAQF